MGAGEVKSLEAVNYFPQLASCYWKPLQGRADGVYFSFTHSTRSIDLLTLLASFQMLNNRYSILKTWCYHAFDVRVEIATTENVLTSLKFSGTLFWFPGHRSS